MRYLILLCLIVCGSCYTNKWNEQKSTVKTNYQQKGVKNIKELFYQQPQQSLKFPLLVPGKTYQYDIAEKSELYDNEDKLLQFETITFQLTDSFDPNKVLVDVYLWDKNKNCLVIKSVDLLRITPALDTRGEMQYAEYLLEEFSRFGVKFRREHNEFSVILRSDDPTLKAYADKIYRVDLTNNCLDPTKWEIQVVTEEYEDFSARLKGDMNYNQNRLLSHGWFYVDKELYSRLLTTKNPHLHDEHVFNYPYDSLSNIAEKTIIDFEQLRQPRQYKIMGVPLAIGHKKEMPLRPIDIETGNKWRMGLLGGDTLLTYKSVLEKPMKLAQFHQEGFYDIDNPKVFNYEYLKHVDKMQMYSLDVKGTDCYVEIELTGKHAPYKFVIGNIDFALLEEQKMYGINVGVNVYPKSQRYNPQQNTIAFAPDLVPEDRKPYFLMVDAKTNAWVNNQYKGVEKAFLSYSGLNKNTLEIYLLSYERELPLWYGKVRLSGGFRELVRARKNLYAK